MVRLFAFSNLAMLCVLSGCGQSSYETAPVRGRVMLSGVPFPQGGIMFAPVHKGDATKAGKPAVGRIQPDGTFQLTTFETNDGAIVGEHWVTIINHDEDNMPDGVPEFARIQVPERKVVEARKDNQIDISLTREAIRKYREDDR